jgi:hypothetical protein
MRFNVISNLANGVGLQRDFIQLQYELQRRGHTVKGVQFNAKPFVITPADVNIFDEVVNPDAFRAAPKQWVMPHPEWWFAGWDQYPYDKVLAKTRDCERIFKAKFGAKCQYLGWLARDLYQPEVQRERKFLHVAGKSRMKNTSAVILGCQHAGVPLTVISEYVGTVRKRITDHELAILMNSHFCHVMPSEYEGYGHVLHEARGASQIVITTNAPPMNELRPAVLVPSESTSRHHEGLLHRVSARSVADAVNLVLSMSAEDIRVYRAEARAMFEQEVVDFQKALDGLVGRVYGV